MDRKFTDDELLKHDCSRCEKCEHSEQKREIVELLREAGYGRDVSWDVWQVPGCGSWRQEFDGYMAAFRDLVERRKKSQGHQSVGRGSK